MRKSIQELAKAVGHKWSVRIRDKATDGYANMTIRKPGRGMPPDTWVRMLHVEDERNRGEGGGTRLLSRIKRFTLRHGGVAKLGASAEEPENQERLERWYGKEGWERTKPGGAVFRYPPRRGRH
jgi:hypothetical protein